MARKFVRIGSMENIHVYDDGDYASGVETDSTMVAGQAPVLADEVLRLGDIPSSAAELLHSDGNITDHAIVRGDGGARKVQGSLVTIDDAGSIFVPVGASVSIADLTNGYIPYHVSDVIGLANSNIYYDSVNGRVGIGMTNPDSQLNVYKNGGSALTVGTDSGSNAILNLYESTPLTDDTGGRVYYDGASNNLVLGTLASGVLSNRMVIGRDTGRVGIGTTNPGQLVELAQIETLIANKNDGYSAALRLGPAYVAAAVYTVTRHNYIDIQDVAVGGAGPAAVTNAAVLRFDAAIGAHKALAAAFQTIDSNGDTIDWAAGIIVNINGALYKVPIIAL